MSENEKSPHAVNSRSIDTKERLPLWNFVVLKLNKSSKLETSCATFILRTCKVTRLKKQRSTMNEKVF